MEWAEQGQTGVATGTQLLADAKIDPNRLEQRQTVEVQTDVGGEVNAGKFAYGLHRGATTSLICFPVLPQCVKRNVLEIGEAGS